MWRDRNILLGKPNVQKGGEVCTYKNNFIAIFVTTFSIEYHHIVNIIKKNLPILYTDKELHAVLGPGCRFWSRRAPTLGTLLSPSLLKK